MRLLWGLIVPVTAAFTADAALGTSPWLALVAALVCIPLATVLVSQAALHEMNRVIEQVAPHDEAPDQAEPAGSSITGGQSLPGNQPDDHPGQSADK